MNRARQIKAAQFIASHGHIVHLDGERIIAESECVHSDGQVSIEYGTFAAPYSATEIRGWLGY